MIALAVSSVSVAAVILSDLGADMLNAESMAQLLRTGCTAEMHDQLDSACPGTTQEERFRIAHWRAAALSEEKRYPEALNHLRETRSDFPCKTVSFDEAARILEHLGFRNEAIEELKSSPFSEESDKYPILVKDARFLLLYLLLKSGIFPTDPSFDEFPSQYRSVLPNDKNCYAEHLSIEDLLALSKNITR